MFRIYVSETHTKNNIHCNKGVLYSPTGITDVLFPASLHLACRTLPLCTQLAEVYGWIYDSTDLQHQQWTPQRHETPTATNKLLSATRLLVLSHCLRNIVSLCASIPMPRCLTAVPHVSSASMRASMVALRKSYWRGGGRDRGSPWSKRLPLSPIWLTRRNTNNNKDMLPERPYLGPFIFVSWLRGFTMHADLFLFHFLDM